MGRAAPRPAPPGMAKAPRYSAAGAVESATMLFAAANSSSLLLAGCWTLAAAGPWRLAGRLLGGATGEPGQPPTNITSTSLHSAKQTSDTFWIG